MPTSQHHHYTAPPLHRTTAVHKNGEGSIHRTNNFFLVMVVMSSIDVMGQGETSMTTRLTRITYKKTTVTVAFFLSMCVEIALLLLSKRCLRQTKPPHSRKLNSIEVNFPRHVDGRLSYCQNSLFRVLFTP